LICTLYVVKVAPGVAKHTPFGEKASGYAPSKFLAYEGKAGLEHHAVVGLVTTPAVAGGMITIRRRVYTPRRRRALRVGAGCRLWVRVSHASPSPVQLPNLHLGMPKSRKSPVSWTVVTRL
jgi:hypothetical protein